MLGAEGALLSVTDSRHPIGRDSQGDKEITSGVGPAVSQAQVIGHAASLVAVSFDLDRDAGIGAQEIRASR